MKIKIDKEAVKYLQTLIDKDRIRILEKINDLKLNIEIQSLIPVDKFDIKKLNGIWDGYYRLRVGKFRIIFKYLRDEFELHIYHIHIRGDVYKK